MNTEPDHDYDTLPAPLQQALRDALVATGHAIPVTTAEVAAFDSAHEATSAVPPDDATVNRFMKRWSAFKAEAATMPTPRVAGSETLAIAARSGTPISDETKTTISDLVREMEKEDPHAPPL